MLKAPANDSQAFHFAEWLELQAIYNWPHPTGQAELRSLLEGVGDDLALFDSCDQLDEQVEAIVQAVFEELENRQKWAGTGYPFEVGHGNIKLRNAPENTLDFHLGYLLSLLTTFYRFDYYSTLAKPKNENDAFPNSSKLEDYFQACGTIAAAGFISGNSASFGFPRPDKTTFYEKLTEVADFMAEGSAKTAWSPGASSNPKDAGVDVIAWKELPDKLPGQIYLLGQCASGENWQTKAPLRDYSNFHEYYWTMHPHSPIISAVFIPFDLRHFVQIGHHQDLIEAWKHERWRMTKDFGIVIDRFRLAHFFAAGVGIAANKCFKIESVELIADLNSWVKNGIEFLRAS